MLNAPSHGAFLLGSGITFLNHGSFGACPHPVLQAQLDLRAEIEANPVRFLARELPARLDGARQEVARFVGARPCNLAFVRNATSGVNAVLRSLDLAAGDELLVTDHAYAACRNAVDFAARQAGASVRVARIPFPVGHPGEVVEAVLAVVTPRTRLALIDHVTSPTGLVLPAETLVAELQRRGVDVLVDGAHGPGMLDLDLESLGSAYYTGNFHKWCCAPRGAAMLWVREDRQEGIHPAVISHGYAAARGERRFPGEFDWTGTDDPTPWLCIPTALRHLGSTLPGGWPELRQRCRTLALAARTLIAEALGQALPAPDEMVGFLASLPLPDAAPIHTSAPNLPDSLQLTLYEKYGIEVPVIPWPMPPKRLLRISAMVYNHPGEYEELARCLTAELARERKASCAGA